MSVCVRGGGCALWESADVKAWMYTAKTKLLCSKVFGYYSCMTILTMQIL